MARSPGLRLSLDQLANFDYQFTNRQQSDDQAQHLHVGLSSSFIFHNTLHLSATSSW